jgi:hypothetical protein
MKEKSSTYWPSSKILGNLQQTYIFLALYIYNSSVFTFDMFSSWNDKIFFMNMKNVFMILNC